MKREIDGFVMSRMPLWQSMCLYARASRLGLAASSDNDVAARSVGVRTDRIRYGLLWVLDAFATGTVGALIYLQKARISPDAAFSVVDWTAYVLFVVVIGGMRTIECPIVGVLVLWALQFNLSGYGGLHLLILGLIAAFVMLFMQRGIWGSAAVRCDLQLFPSRKRLFRQNSDPDQSGCSAMGSLMKPHRDRRSLAQRIQRTH
jgi:branched-chain amino acid transport system permease protein